MRPSSLPIYITTISLTIMTSFGVFAENAGSDPSEDFVETNYSYGKVLAVTPHEISITEYDYDKDKEVNTSYSVGPAVELQSILSLDQLAVGDEIEISYESRDGKNIALTISRPQVEDDPEEPVDAGGIMSADQNEMPMNNVEVNAQTESEQKGEQ